MSIHQNAQKIYFTFISSIKIIKDSQLGTEHTVKQILVATIESYYSYSRGKREHNVIWLNYNYFYTFCILPHKK